MGKCLGLLPRRPTAPDSEEPGLGVLKGAKADLDIYSLLRLEHGQSRVGENGLVFLQQEYYGARINAEACPGLALGWPECPQRDEV